MKMMRSWATLIVSALFLLLVESSEKGFPAIAGHIKGIEKLFKSISSLTGRKSPLLPKLLPHEDNCYLLEFHTDNCDYCDQMEPVLQRLEEDLSTKVRGINVSRRRDFVSLLEAIGHDEYGGFPFYFNRRTAQAIGGPTGYMNLKRWATGDIKHMFQDAPENLFERDTDFSNRRDIGAKGMFMEKLLTTGKSKKSKSITTSTEKDKAKANAKAKAIGDKKVVSDSKNEAQPLSAAERTKLRRQAREEKTKASK